MVPEFWLRRLYVKNDRRYISWHSYKTAARRDKAAEKYRERGDVVWVQRGDYLNVMPMVTA
jgi:hypothetical protein